MRTDPSDTGGLFIRRRPGTAPIHYRAPPVRGSRARRGADELLAAALLVLMTFINLLFWGPIPIGWLWVGSQVDYQSGSITLGIFVAFIGLLLMLLVALGFEKRLDHAWILVRRAAGHDQRTGVLGRVFAATAAIGAIVFTAWFLVIHGPGSSVFSPRS